jgi:hypothetical protein
MKKIIIVNLLGAIVVLFSLLNYGISAVNEKQKEIDRLKELKIGEYRMPTILEMQDFLAESGLIEEVDGIVGPETIRGWELYTIAKCSHLAFIKE